MDFIAEIKLIVLRVPRKDRIVLSSARNVNLFFDLFSVRLNHLAAGARLDEYLSEWDTRCLSIAQMH